MSKLKDKIVLITGASSGIGLACAKKLAEQGAKLILAARRKERLKTLADELRKSHKAESHIVELDVRDHKAVRQTIENLPAAWQTIDVLVNNAGLSRGLDKTHESKIEDWEEMIDTNVKGLLYVTRAVLPGMVKRNSGMVVNIGSIAGYQPYPKGNVYAATKAAVDSLTHSLRMELVDTAVRICTVDPGLVKTEFSEVRFRGDKERAKTVYQGFQPLMPEDVANAVLFCATQPPHVQIAQIVLMPTNQASTTMVHRKT
jgi:serine 3-dehydrogenase